MGQKINPQSLRLGVTKQWPVRWFFVSKGPSRPGSSGYKTFLQDDEAIRAVVRSKVGQAGIASLEIERTAGKLKIIVKAARPGFIIGRGGKGIEELTGAIEKKLKALRPGRAVAISLDVEELKRSETAATYVAQQIAWDIERRMPYRQLMNKNADAVMQNKDIKGVKIVMSGRLDGGEIARRERKILGSLPLQTLRADIDYGSATAFTSYGAVGVKVWIYKGQIFHTESRSSLTKPQRS